MSPAAYLAEDPSMPRWTKLLLLAVVFAAAVWLVGPIQRNLQVDLCLDRGGAWDDGSESCRYDAPK
jgi:hypothetical protein